MNECEYREYRRPSPPLALTLTLRRLAFPNRWRESCNLFGRSYSWLSGVFTDIIAFLTRRYNALLRWHPRIQYHRIQVWAQALINHGYIGRIWGFMDGHFQEVARPLVGQRSFYLGKEGCYRLKWQCIVTPDGIISSVSGPFFGSVHNHLIFETSGITAYLRRIRNGRQWLFLYGDPAYVTSPGIWVPFSIGSGRENLPQT